MSSHVHEAPPAGSSGGFEVGAGVRRAALVAAVVGLGTLGAGLALYPERALSSLLTSGFLFLCLGLGGAVFLALMYVANAGWFTVFKRIPEAFSAYVPWGAAPLLALVPFAPKLYLWARPGVMETDHLLHKKAAFLNVPFFGIRMVLMLALWVGFTWLLRRNSLKQDTERTEALTKRNVATSAVFLVLFGLTFCLAAFDWLMSLEPHWFSTIYALYNFAGLLSSSVCAITVAAILLHRAGALPQLNTSHLHDLGKLMFGFATLWAYLWFSQFLLIWYANIPEETAYFIPRMHGGWAVPFYLNIVLNWALPFVLLLPRPAKRNPAHLLRVAAILLAGRWLDLHLMVAPANMPDGAGLGLYELAGIVGVGGLFLLAVTRAVRSAPMIPAGDPYLVESLHHHT
ncbi:hypothetical protein HPC49_24670 [Pyxidicoccus fallax]|uniref:Quinol:cytochrome c oxidoreductase quinone-binding subunit 2 n=1 Tax=Pyxidicoccus fallax TaxID=394095 RepID=A0A848LRT3_9BACT|nr:hypothetical protein [Pyxidicoccus fallax]NMO20648.1 hypothetical protein [Pyxidicoccus fallax]NPC81410.1 hypothetical protein [Pyxidicoccus fallax]